MEINFTKIEVKIQKKPGTHENLLASASLTFREENGGFLTITGFTIWKSKFEGAPLNVEKPGRVSFKFVLCQEILWQKIRQEIIKEYEKSGIPIIEDDKNSTYSNPF